MGSEGRQDRDRETGNTSPPHHHTLNTTAPPSGAHPPRGAAGDPLIAVVNARRRRRIRRHSGMADRAASVAAGWRTGECAHRPTGCLDENPVGCALPVRCNDALTTGVGYRRSRSVWQRGLGVAALSKAGASRSTIFLCLLLLFLPHLWRHAPGGRQRSHPPPRLAARPRLPTARLADLSPSEGASQFHSRRPLTRALPPPPRRKTPATAPPPPRRGGAATIRPPHGRPLPNPHRQAALRRAGRGQQ